APITAMVDPRGRGRRPGSITLTRRSVSCRQPSEALPSRLGLHSRLALYARIRREIEMISVRLAAMVGLLLSPVPALADASLADMGSATACGLDRVREIIAGAEGTSTDAEAVDQLIVE